MKKILSMSLALMMIAGIFTSCTRGQMNETESTVSEIADDIRLVTREVGAGIRDTAADLFGFVADAGSDMYDMTHKAASVKNKTADVVAHVANEEYGVAYVPLSAVTDKVKTLKIDGVEPSAENVKNGKYKFSHKLYAVTNGQARQNMQDFINFILSEQGQQIVTEQGFVSDSNTGAFSSDKSEGKVEVYCADSAEQLLKKLKEAYEKVNDKNTIKIMVKNSKDAIDELDDDENEIAITTRKVTDKEKADEDEGYLETSFAREPIAVIVNPKNDLMNIKSSQVTDIIKGNTTNWSKLG